MSGRSNPQGMQNARTSSIQPSAEIAQRLGEVLRERGVDVPVGYDQAVRLRHLRPQHGDVAGRINSNSAAAPLSSALAFRDPRLRSCTRPRWNRPSRRTNRGPAPATGPGSPGPRPGHPVGEQGRAGQACGPPPERPSTANRSTPKPSAIASTSAATSATVRDSSRSERPYPGLSKVIRQTLSPLAAGSWAVAQPCCPGYRGGRTLVPPLVAEHADGKPPTVGHVSRKW